MGVWNIIFLMRCYWRAKCCVKLERRGMHAGLIAFRFMIHVQLALVFVTLPPMMTPPWIFQELARPVQLIKLIAIKMALWHPLKADETVRIASYSVRQRQNPVWLLMEMKFPIFPSQLQFKKSTRMYRVLLLIVRTYFWRTQMFVRGQANISALWITAF